MTCPLCGAPGHPSLFGFSCDGIGCPNFAPGYAPDAPKALVWRVAYFTLMGTVRCGLTKRLTPGRLWFELADRDDYPHEVLRSDHYTPGCGYLMRVDVRKLPHEIALGPLESVLVHEVREVTLR